MAEAHEIERVEAITEATFRERFDAPAVPVIIAGGARSFARCERFTAEALASKLGSVVLPFKLSRSHKHPDFGAPTFAEMFARGESTLGELLAAMTSGPPEERARRLFTGDERFLLRRRDGQETVDQDLAPLLEDVGFPALFPRSRIYSVWAWLSGAGVRTWLHYDTNGCHNLNAQLSGAKECVLHPPSELARIHPFVLGAGNPATNCSRVDVENVEPAFADYLDVPAWHGRIETGDLLFIPAWWSHTFRHAGELNCNVNFWWKPERPLASPTAQRQAWLDAAARAKVETKGGGPGPELLRALDTAMILGS